MSPRHYVVQAQPQREPLAVKELQNQGFETFYPVIQRRPVVRHLKLVTPAPVPLFPKYLFVRLDLATDPWRSINGTRGVTRLMCMDELPSPVPEGAMERLMSAGEVILEDAAGLPFNVNDPVEFISGPMTGLRGLVQLCAADRVTLLLDLLGSKTVVHCAPAALKYSRE